MKKTLIYDILNLKTNSGYYMLSVNFKKGEDENYSIAVDGDSNLLNLLLNEDDFNKIINLNMQLIQVHKTRLLAKCKKYETDIIPITIWSIEADEKEPYVGINSEYTGGVVSGERGRLLIDTVTALNSLMNTLNEKLEKLIDEYIIEKDEKEFERYEIIFKRTDNGEYRTSYMDFIRNDNCINYSEQKHILKKYLQMGLERRILDILPELNFNIEEFNERVFAVKLFTNGKEIWEPEIMVFDKDEEEWNFLK